MLDNININQNMMMNESFTFKTVAVFDILKQIIISNQTNKEMVIIVKKDILDAISPFLMTRLMVRERTLTKSLKELQEAGLIKQDLNSTKKPSYALTEKSKQYL